MHITIPPGPCWGGVLGKLNTLSALCPALAQQSHSRVAVGKVYSYSGAPASQNS